MATVEPTALFEVVNLCASLHLVRTKRSCLDLFHREATGASFICFAGNRIFLVEHHKGVFALRTGDLIDGSAEDISDVLVQGAGRMFQGNGIILAVRSVQHRSEPRRVKLHLFLNLREDIVPDLQR